MNTLNKYLDFFSLIYFHQFLSEQLLNLFLFRPYYFKWQTFISFSKLQTNKEKIKHFFWIPILFKVDKNVGELNFNSSKPVKDDCRKLVLD